MTRNAELIENEFSALTEGISHALRTPAWTLHEFSRLLEEDAQGRLDAHCEDYLQQIKSGAERLQALVKGVSDYAASCQGDLNPEPVNLSAMVTTIGNDLQMAWTSKKNRLIVEADITVLADAKAIQIALRQLLDNAYKFTQSRERPRIRFGRCSMAGGQGYQIEDNGIGFDPALAYKLFRPFQRLHAQPEYDGLGMGLPIARRIIHRHGGTICAKSTLGQGSCFMFTFADDEQKNGD